MQTGFALGALFGVIGGCAIASIFLVESTYRQTKKLARATELLRKAYREATLPVSLASEIRQFIKPIKRRRETSAIRSGDISLG